MPAQCIYIVKSTGRRSPITWANRNFSPTVFDIDISVCMSCQICVEVCPFDSINMDTEFELSTDDRFGGFVARQASNSPNPTRIITRSTRPKLPRWTGGWRRKGQSRGQGQGGCRSKGQGRRKSGGPFHVGGSPETSRNSEARRRFDHLNSNP